MPLLPDEQVHIKGLKDQLQFTCLEAHREREQMHLATAPPQSQAIDNYKQTKTISRPPVHDQNRSKDIWKQSIDNMPSSSLPEGLKSQSALQNALYDERPHFDMYEDTGKKIMSEKCHLEARKEYMRNKEKMGNQARMPGSYELWRLTRSQTVDPTLDTCVRATLERHRHSHLTSATSDTSHDMVKRHS